MGVLLSGWICNEISFWAHPTPWVYCPYLCQSHWSKLPGGVDPGEMEMWEERGSAFDLQERRVA